MSNLVANIAPMAAVAMAVATGWAYLAWLHKKPKAEPTADAPTPPPSPEDAARSMRKFERAHWGAAKAAEKKSKPPNPMPPPRQR